MVFKLQIFSIVSSLLLFSVSLLAVIFGNGLLKSFVSSNLKLDPRVDFYKQWLKPPVPVYLHINLFNLKNPNEFMAGAKPMVEEIGPFVYREYIRKDDIEDNLNFTISYKERKYYIFQPALSPYSESYPITMVNMAPIALLDKIKFMPDLVLAAVNGALLALNETLIVTKPANEMIFGYKDNLLSFLKKFNVIDGDLIPSEYVGLFMDKNNTYEGTYTVFTGADDVNKLGVIERFNFADTVSVWSSSWANMINGTDGTLYAPFMDKSKPVFIFNNDLCRSLYVDFNTTARTDYHSIEMFVYKPSEFFFEDHLHNPENGGFCTPAGNCLGAGVLNLTACQGGIPIIMSNPHFVYADPIYSNEVDGLNPDCDKHLTLLGIEPTTGVPMQASKRVQFNTKLSKNAKIDITKSLPEVMYPLFWVDENFKIDEASADKFHSQVMMPLALFNTGKWVLLVVGFVLFTLSGAYAYRNWKSSKQSEEREKLYASNNAFYDQEDGDSNAKSNSRNGSVII